MLKATGVKTERMNEDNDIEKKQGFLKKRQTTDSPQSSLEKLGMNVSQLQLSNIMCLSYLLFLYYTFKSTSLALK